MQKKQKVLFAITKSNWGGAQRYVYDLATYFHDGNSDVVVVSGKRGLLTERLEQARIRTVILPSLERDVGILKELKTFIALLLLFRREKPNIVHLNSSKIGAMGALAGRFARVKKIIFTAHGWAHKEERSHFSKGIIQTLHFLTVFFSHTTIAVSQEVKDQMKYPFIKGKIKVVYNGVGDMEFKKKEDARALIIKDGVKVPKNALWVGTISELHKNKGLTHAINALIHLPLNVAFFIIGDGEEEVSLKKLVEESGLTKKVFFLGYKKNAAMYLKAFDIFLLSSIKEGFPYVLLEIGKAEVPTIATDIGGIPEIIKDLETGLLIQPKRSDEIAAAIEFLSNNPKKKEWLAKNLKEKVEKEFSIEKMQKETAKLYRY